MFHLRFLIPFSLPCFSFRLPLLFPATTVAAHHKLTTPRCSPPLYRPSPAAASPESASRAHTRHHSLCEWFSRAAVLHRAFRRVRPPFRPFFVPPCSPLSPQSISRVIFSFPALGCCRSAISASVPLLLWPYYSLSFDPWLLDSPTASLRVLVHC